MPDFLTSASRRASVSASHPVMPLVEITIGEALRQQARKNGDATALIFADDEIDYATLYARVDVLARALIALGIQAGHRVAVMSPNAVEWVLLEYALARIGAVMVTVNPAFRSQELGYLLGQGKVSALFTVRAHRRADIAEDIAAPLPDHAEADPVCKMP